jgi:hypothetical protein
MTSVPLELFLVFLFVAGVSIWPTTDGPNYGKISKFWKRYRQIKAVDAVSPPPRCLTHDLFLHRISSGKHGFWSCPACNTETADKAGSHIRITCR